MLQCRSHSRTSLLQYPVAYADGILVRLPAVVRPTPSFEPEHWAFHILFPASMTATVNQAPAWKASAHDRCTSVPSSLPVLPLVMVLYLMYLADCNSLASPQSPISSSRGAPDCSHDIDAARRDCSHDPSRFRRTCQQGSCPYGPIRHALDFRIIGCLGTGRVASEILTELPSWAMTSV